MRLDDRVRRRTPTGPLVGLVGLIALLAVLAATSGLGTRGWVAGVLCGLGLVALLARALRGHGRSRLTVADVVTLSRAVLACGVAALTADAFGGPISVPTLVTLSTVALVLDGVDGRVARRTGSASVLGARFDMETDAFLIMVLSVYVALDFGWWVLGFGLARYLFVAAGWVLPWLRGPEPPRRWARAVAAGVGVFLTVAAAGVLPREVAVGMLVVGLAMLLESFGRSIRGFWVRTHTGPFLPAPDAGAAWVAIPAVLLIWVALLVPDRIDDVTLSAFLRIPVEGLIFVALVLVLPRRAARVVAVLGGFVLGVLTVVRLCDMGFRFAFDRPFHPVYDHAYGDSAIGLLGDSIGRTGAVVVAVAAAVLVVALIAVLPQAALRLTDVVAGHRESSLTVLTVATAVALVAAVSAPSASPSTLSARLAYAHAAQVRDDLRDQREFRRALDRDAFRSVPDGELLTALRGKDVLVVFVESYGRSALGLPAIETALDAGDRRLRDARFSSRSAFLTSSTFGGLSWLAHITLQSGLRVDNQGRYDQLVTLDRRTLTDAFGRAGWRTVVTAPGNDEDWSVATTFYHYDQVYDSRNVGYVGPPFSFAAMPDQYTLAALHRLEFDKADRRPVLAEVDLISSHLPWAPLPRLVDWGQVGDGSVFHAIRAEGKTPQEVWRNPESLKAAYAESVAYSLDAVTSYVEQLGDPNLVLVVLGDHPARTVLGDDTSRDVPVSIVAADPSVVDRAADWGWRLGLRPAADAPVWPMEDFRDRFLTAYR